MMEFEKLTKDQKESNKLNKEECWRPPPDDIYKINIDGSFRANLKKGGWGFIIRNSLGQFLEGGVGNISRVTCPLQAEALAALYALQHAAQLGMTNVILETDASMLGCALKSTDLDRSPLGALFIQIRELMFFQFNSCKISVCSRICNKVADCMAAYGTCVITSGSHMFMSQAPPFVSELVSRDKPGVSC